MKQYRFIFGVMAILVMLAIVFGYVLIRVNFIIDNRLEPVNKTDEHSTVQMSIESKDIHGKQLNIVSQLCDL